MNLFHPARGRVCGDRITPSVVLAMLTAISACGSSGREPSGGTSPPDDASATGGAKPADAEPSADAGGCGDPLILASNETRLVSLDPASQFEAEPFVAIQDQDIAVAWEASGCDRRTRIGYTRRHGFDAAAGGAADTAGTAGAAGAAGAAGTAFPPPRYLESPDGQEASNVALALDPSGALFAVWASWSHSGGDGGPVDIRIQFARWPAGEAGFEPPVELDERGPTLPLNDKPWLTRTAGGALVVTYGDIANGGIVAASSIDGGATFRHTVIDPAPANLAASCPDGRPQGAYVTYWAESEIRLSHTTDGGLTWSAPVTMATPDTTSSIAYDDPTCVASGDDVWVLYGRTHDGFDVAVPRLIEMRLVHSRLGAAGPDATHTFPSTDAISFYLHPQLTRRADGSLAVAAYAAATADAGDGALTAALVAFLIDDDLTMASAATLATGLLATRERHVPSWLGDYFGWAPLGAGLAAAFVDNGSGRSHIAFIETATPATVAKDP